MSLFFMPELIEDTQAHQAKIKQACQNVSSPNFQAAELWKKMKWTIVTNQCNMSIAKFRVSWFSLLKQMHGKNDWNITLRKKSSKWKKTDLN